MLPGMVDAMTPSSLSGAGLKKAMAGVSNLKEGGGSNVTVALVSKPATAAPNSGFAKRPGPRGHSGETNIFLHHVVNEYGNTIKGDGKRVPPTVQNGTSAPANVNCKQAPPKTKADTTTTAPPPTSPLCARWGAASDANSSHLVPGVRTRPPQFGALLLAGTGPAAVRGHEHADANTRSVPTHAGSGATIPTKWAEGRVPTARHTGQTKQDKLVAP